MIFYLFPPSLMGFGERAPFRDCPQTTKLAVIPVALMALLKVPRSFCNIVCLAVFLFTPYKQGCALAVPGGPGLAPNFCSQVTRKSGAPNVNFRKISARKTI